MDTVQPPVDVTRVLLVDLDNCPNQLSQLSQAINHFSRVVVCYGGFDPKIPLNQLIPLASALVAGRLIIESMDRKGKNAADFGLTFWAGRLLAETSPETEFLVLSRDTDLEHLMSMLRRAGRTVERMDGNTYLIQPGREIIDQVNREIAESKPPTPVSELAEATDEYYGVHIAGQQSRPSRRIALLNSIRSYFKTYLTLDPETVMEELFRRGVVSQNRNGQLRYHERSLSPPTTKLSEIAQIPIIETVSVVSSEMTETEMTTATSITKVIPQKRTLPRKSTVLSGKRTSAKEEVIRRPRRSTPRKMVKSDQEPQQEVTLQEDTVLESIANTPENVSSTP